MKVYCNCCGKLFTSSMVHRKVAGNIEVCDDCYSNVNGVCEGKMNLQQLDLSHASEQLKTMLINYSLNDDNGEEAGNVSSSSSYYEKENASNIQRMSDDIHFIKNVVMIYVILSIVTVIIIGMRLL